MKDWRNWALLVAIVAIFLIVWRDCEGNKEPIIDNSEQERAAYKYKIGVLKDSVRLAKKETDTLLFVAATLDQENKKLKKAISYRPKTYTPKEATEQLPEDDSLVRDQAFDSLQAVALRAWEIADSLGKVIAEIQKSIEEQESLWMEVDSVNDSRIKALENQLADTKEEYEKQMRRVRWKYLGLGTMIGAGLRSFVP